MKCVIISDTHNMFDQILGVIPKEGDILIHCGDFSNRGTLPELAKFAKQMENLNYKHKIVVPGNHDSYTAKNIELSKNLFEDNNIKQIIDEPFEIEGIKFYGSPYTPKYGNWEFMKPRGEQIKKVWDKIPDDTQFLITHGPPYGILDYVPYDKINVGCQDLLIRVHQLKELKYHAFGHIHYCGGQSVVHNDITFVNAAICTESYEPKNKIMEIEL